MCSVLSHYQFLISDTFSRSRSSFAPADGLTPGHTMAGTPGSPLVILDHHLVRDVNQSVWYKSAHVPEWSSFISPYWLITIKLYPTRGVGYGSRTLARQKAWFQDVNRGACTIFPPNLRPMNTIIMRHCLLSTQIRTEYSWLYRAMMQYTFSST